MTPVVLLFLVVAAPPRTAVADLSVRPEPALAEALRRLPDLAGEPLPAAKTAMVVADAAKLGIVCSLSDARCLQKILVLARVDELVAFEVSGRTVSIARVTSRTAAFAKTRRAGSASANARAAWAALARADEANAPMASRDPEGPTSRRLAEPGSGAGDATSDADPGRTADDAGHNGHDGHDDGGDGETAGYRRRGAEGRALEETATASSAGVTLPLLVAGSAAGATVLLGAATLGVSAVVANQVRATERGIPLDESYDAANALFWGLAGLTVVSGGTAAVATALHFVGEGAEAP